MNQKDKLEEATRLALQGKLNEDSNGTEVELNGLKRTLSSQDEVDCFNVVKRSIDILDTFVVDWNVMLSQFGQKAYVVFRTRDGKGEFEVDFSTNTFGKVDKIETTFSNQEITDSFMKLLTLLRENLL